MGDGVNIAARLEGIAEPNGICLSGAAYEQVRDKLKEEFVDLGDKELKNIARPVRAYRVTLNQDAAKSVLSVVHGGSLALPTSLRLPCSPFQNMSGDPEQEYFADGLAEDIITRLSRLRWLFVSARNSSFAYKGKASTRGRSAANLACDTCSTAASGVPGTVFELRPGQATRRPACSCGPTDTMSSWRIFLRFRIRSPRTSSPPSSRDSSGRTATLPQHFPDNLDAWGFVMKAMPYVWNWSSPNEIEVAQALLTRATELDPDYSRANSLLAWTHASRFQSGLTVAADVLPAAHAMVQRAIQRDPEDPCAISRQAMCTRSRGVSTLRSGS